MLQYIYMSEPLESNGENHPQFKWSDVDQEEMNRLALRAQERRRQRDAEATAYAKAEGEVDEISDESNRETLEQPFIEDLDIDPEIESVAKNIGKLAASLGLKNAKAINEVTIHDLDKDYWHDIPLRDVILEMWDDELGFIESPKFEDLLVDELQSGDLFRRTIEKTKLATDFLDSVGVERLELLEWGLMGSEQQKHAMRCLTWVMKRGFMQGYVNDLKERAVTFEASTYIRAVVEELTGENFEEIKKQFDNFYFREETPQSKNQRTAVPNQVIRRAVFSPDKDLWNGRTHRAFEIAKKELDITLAVCQQVFLTDLEAGIYGSPMTPDEQSTG